MPLSVFAAVRSLLVAVVNVVAVVVVVGGGADILSFVHSFGQPASHQSIRIDRTVRLVLLVRPTCTPAPTTRRQSCSC